MQITNGKVVSIDYTLRDNENAAIDTSEGREPLTYLHGSGQILPGLEEKLEGHKVADELSVAIPAEKGYGQRDDSKVTIVPRDQIQAEDELQVGSLLQADTPTGPSVFTVSKIEGDDITLDGNHPLAGIDLNFHVIVRGVRDATPEEVSHGHVHGPGGHHH